ncbi:MAG TPA: ATP-binding protein [Macromonas sp.]|nr:ATP-binding protein [Macromonas sp.]
MLGRLVRAGGWRVQDVPFHVWLALALGLLLFGLFWVSRPAAVAQAFNVEQAEVSWPAQPQTAARTVRLPHILDDEVAGLQDAAHYRFHWPQGLTYPSAQEPRLALLLPRVGTRFRVLLNGHELYDVGWYRPPQKTVNAAWMPYLIALPAPLLTPAASDNRIEIEVQGQLLERSGLWPLQLGSMDVLRDRYQTLYGWQVTGTWMMIMVALGMVFMAIFLWGAMRERLFGLMAAASLAHTVRMVLSVLIEPPLSFEVYFLLHRVSFSAYCAFIFLFTEELFELRLPTIRRLGYLILLIGPLWMSLTLYLRDYDLYRIWAGGLALSALLAVGQVLCATRFTATMGPHQKPVMVVALFTLLTGLRDFLVIQLNLPGDADIRWMSIGSLALMITLGWVLLRRSTESIREVRRLNATLEQTVAERETELRTAFEQIHISEQQRFIEDERKRLMRDMHDGLGSQLVQTLNMVRSHRDALDGVAVEAMLQHALEELRMTLDSLEPMDGDLPTILGTLRSRIAPALKAAGIELDWQVEEVPPITSLDSQGVMHLFRCLQEVFANVFKHARATKVRVRTWADEGVVHMCVEDNGIGMGASMPTSGRGRGLNNIRVRAQKVGARVRVYHLSPGTGIQLVFLSD